MKKKNIFRYFSIGEYLLWGISFALIIGSFIVFDRKGYATLLASLIGVTAILFNAKANPIGQALILIFAVFYAVISYAVAYYGEMITYLGMSAPMAIVALVSWLKNPYKGKKSEVEINVISKKECGLMFLMAAVVSVAFYFILKAFDTANLIPSTISVTTSFLAAYLTFRRSEYFPLAYAANDVILIVLWIMKTVQDLSYLSMVVCFVAFIANDLYGYISWKKIRRRQAKNK